jgi:hypothetical protein
MSVADTPGLAHADRDLAAVAAGLLDQGRRIDGLSRLLTAGAFVTLMLLPILPKTSWLLPAILVAVALLGLGEIYLAIRVGFDAALFRHLASDRNGFDLERLDRALAQLELVPEAKAERGIDERIAGARRLFGWQGLILTAQAVLILAGAGLFVLLGIGGR